MTPEEARSRRRHPSGRQRALRAVHSDSHTWGRAPGTGSEKPADVAVRPSAIAVVAVAELAAGVVVAAWSGDWRVLVTAVALFAVLAVIGARVDRRPR